MTAHQDFFTRDRLPPRGQWPELDLEGAGLHYPATLNAAEELLDRAVERGWGARPALRWPGGTWSYAELRDRANRIARVLRDDLRLVPGNRVLLRGPNGPMLAACWFGTLKAGGVCVTTMPLLRARELEFMIRKAEIRLALCDERLGEELEVARTAAPVLERIVGYGIDGASELERAMSRVTADPLNLPTGAEETAIIAFTSGTTGEAKGTMHFHRDLLAICDLFPASCLQASPSDLFTGSPPFAFTFGLGGLLLFPLRIGASALLLEAGSPPHLLQGMAEHRATVCFTAPTAYRAMLALLKDHDLSALRKCVSAGEHLPETTFHAWKEATGISIIDGIGATEMLHIFISAPEDAVRPGSTGRVVPGYRVKIVGLDGVEVPCGEIGRLAVQGPTGCRYLDNPERQRAYVAGGWNFPGDSFVQDPDGYFWFQSRTDDLIISSGYNIAAAEIENVLLEHPAVQEAGVVGAPDQDRGQLIKAFIVLTPGHSPSEALARALQDHVKAQIAPYKYPRAIEFVSALPRTETGKLQRYRLRERPA